MTGTGLKVNGTIPLLIRITVVLLSFGKIQLGLLKGLQPRDSPHPGNHREAQKELPRLLCVLWGGRGDKAAPRRDGPPLPRRISCCGARGWWRCPGHPRRSRGLSSLPDGAAGVSAGSAGGAPGASGTGRDGRQVNSHGAWCLPPGQPGHPRPLRPHRSCCCGTRPPPPQPHDDELRQLF